MVEPANSFSRLRLPSDVGRLVAQGRRWHKVSQEKFAAKIGISRKTLSDFERGVAQHISLKTAMNALWYAGYALGAMPHLPTLSEVMAESAAHRDRVDRMTQEEALTHKLKR